MSLESIICDWNGTLIEYRNEKPMLDSIAAGIFKSSIPFHPLKLIHIMQAKKEMTELFTGVKHNTGIDMVKETFNVYNTRILKGVSVSFIQKQVIKYANSQETQEKLDFRVLRIIRECHQAGKITGILSAGYQYCIEQILSGSGYNEYFDFYKADSLSEENGKAIGFEMNIFHNKHKLLAQLIDEMHLDASKTAYIGDSEDDGYCFEIVGYPVLSFFAPEELKQRFSRQYHAFIPKDEQDLSKYLNNT